MYNFTVRELAGELSHQQTRMLTWHGRHYIELFKGCNFPTLIQQSISQFPPDAEMMISGNYGTNDLPCLIFGYETLGLSLGFTVKIPTPNSVNFYISEANSKQQGSGYITAVLPSIIHCAQQFGAHQISLTSAEIGKYAWPRLGFWPCNMQERRLLQPKLGLTITEWLREEIVTKDEASELSLRAEDLITNPRAVRALFKCAEQSPHRKTAVFKFLRKHPGMFMAFDLNPDGADVEYFNRYVAAKNCAAR